VNLTVNGKPLEFPDGSTGADLLAHLGIPAATTVAEVNGVIVPREQFVERHLQTGDEIELVTIVGGG
jgi:thiamine biosynthesis protein ThiS